MEMETRQNGVTSENSFSHNDQVMSHDEMLARRLKNRERQRRYRARKRLQAEFKKASASKQITSPETGVLVDIDIAPNHITTQQMEIPVGSVSRHSSGPCFVSRVYSGRDWKRDARRAHELKFQGSCNGPFPFEKRTALTGENQTSSLSSDLIGPVNSVKQSPDSIETQRVVISRRNWKAEARNKFT